LGARGSRAGWALPLAAVLGIAFVLVERRAGDPILPLGLFKQRVIAVASVGGTLIGSAMMATITFVPLFVQGVLEGSPTAAGSAIAPMAIGWPLASAIGGRMLPRIGFRPLVRGGLLITACAAASMAWLMRPGVGTVAPRVAAAFFGVGLGFANTALLIAVQSSVGWAERGVATASTLLFRTVGGALALGNLREGWARPLAERPDLAEQAARLLAGSAVPHDAAVALGDALATGLHTVFVSIAVLSALAVVVGFTFPFIPIERERR
jgi:hypothetical protein